MKAWIIILLSYLLLILSSCELIVDLDVPPHQTKIVVNSIITTDSSYLRFQLSEDQFILDEQEFYNDIYGAQIEVLKNGQSIGFAEEEDAGYYFINSESEPGTNYQIKISSDNYENVFASATLPNRQSNPAIVEIKTKFDEYGGQDHEITYEINDQPGKDFYQLKLFTILPDLIYIEEEDTSYTEIIGYYKNEVYYNPINPSTTQFEDYSDHTIFSDELFDGKKYTNKILASLYFKNFPELFEEEPFIYIELRHLSENYYKYLKSKELQSSSYDNPFSEPAPVYSNIEGGLGIFAGYSTEQVKHVFD